MSKIKLAGKSISEILKRIKRAKRNKTATKNQEKAGLSTKSIKPWNYRAGARNEQIVPVKKQSQTGSSFQPHKVRGKQGAASIKETSEGSAASWRDEMDKYFGDLRPSKFFKKASGGDINTGMKKLSPKQKAIAAKAPPPDKIDAKDFAVLKAEKAKGRGMGLQDESIKPGKVQKAFLGKMIKGAGKSVGRLFGRKQSATATPGAATMSGSGKGMGKMLPQLLQKAIDDGIVKTANKGKVMKARSGEFIKRRMELMGAGKSIDKKAFKKTLGVMPTIDKAFPRLKADPTKPISSVKPNVSNSYMKSIGVFPKVSGPLKKKKLPGRVGTVLGVLSTLVPATYAGLKQYKDYKSAKKRDKAKVKKYSVGGGADMSRKNKKSKSGSSVKDIFKSYGKYDGKPIELNKGGGMMRRPMGYGIGGGVEKAKEHKKIIKDKAGTALGYLGEMAKTISKATPAGAALEATKKVAETIKNKKEQKRIGRFEDRIQMPESRRPKPTLPGRPMPFPVPGRPRGAKPMPDVPGKKRERKPMPDVPGRKRKAIPLFGGGMMKPMGYKSGTMVKARGCKLGRTRPTKIT